MDRARPSPGGRVIAAIKKPGDLGWQRIAIAAEAIACFSSPFTILQVRPLPPSCGTFDWLLRWNQLCLAPSPVRSFDGERCAAGRMFCGN